MVPEGPGPEGVALGQAVFVVMVNLRKQYHYSKNPSNSNRSYYNA